MTDFNASRPLALAPQFSAHVVGDRHVLLLSEQRSFRLAGKLYVALVPHLDGRLSGEGIVQAFDGRVPAERMRTTLASMLEKGYVAYVDADAPTARQALWVELGLVPADAERALAGRSVAVAAAARPGTAADGGRALEAALRQAGIAVASEAGAGLTVVPVEDYLQRDLADLNRAMRSAGRSWLPFKPGGSQPMFGPVFRPDAAPCWHCLTRRMIENRPGDVLVEGDPAAVRPARGFTGATLDFAAGFAAVELARYLAGDTSAGLDGSISSFDLKTRAWRGHLVRLDANCPVCGEPHDPARILERAKAPIVLQAQAVQPQTDGGWRTRTAADVVASLERYVSPITGLISGLENCSVGDGLPVYQARQSMPQAESPRKNRLVGRPSGAAGKGMTDIQAKASCLGEAMERYLCGFTGREPRRRTTRAELGDAAPHPHDYLNYSERQYDGRETWNKEHGDGFNWVGERFDAARPIEWTPAWSLTHGAVRWLPTRYCYFSYFDAEDGPPETQNQFCRSDSNGCASGGTLEEAILQGFLELIERDACALWWYNRVRRPAFDLDAMDDPFVRRIQAHYRRLGRDLQVLDLTNDFGVPAVIAVSHLLADGSSVMFGLGAHLDVGITISRALAELNQMAVLESGMAELIGKPGVTGTDSEMLDWMKNHTIYTEPYVVPDGIVDPARYPRPRIADLKQAVEHCVRVVADRGLDMIVRDCSRPEIDFATARVVVPGMRHFWARYRPGRLYQAPVDLGWIDKPLDEGALNPVAFFL